MITTKQQRKLISAAFRRFGNIQPIGKAKSLCDSRSFTVGVGKIYGGKLQYWFEDENGSSHIIIEGLNNGKN
jgi:hypothetical protein